MGRHATRHLTKKQAYFETVGIKFEKPIQIPHQSLWTVYSYDEYGWVKTIKSSHIDTDDVPDNLKAQEYSDMLEPYAQEIDKANKEVLKKLNTLNEAICKLNDARNKAWQVITSHADDQWFWGRPYATHSDDYHEKIKPLDEKIKELETQLATLTDDNPQSKILKKEIKNLEDLKKTL